MAGGEKYVFSSYDPQNKDAGNQERIERLKKNKHKSKLLQGDDVYNKYKDVDRNTVISGVTQTILHHMQQANQQSADETAAVKTEVLAMKNSYEGELNGLEATAAALQAAKDEKSRLAPLPANARTGMAGIFRRKSNEKKAHKAADDKIEKNEKSYDKKKKDLLSKADKDFQKLNDLNNRHDASITEISNRYDDQAMKYYQLNRDNLVTLDADHIKNIQQFVGYLPLERVEFEAKLDAIKQSPGTGDELTIKARPNPQAGDGIDADQGDSNILHHKYIQAALLEGFDKSQGQIDVSSGEFKPVGQITPDGEDKRDLKMDDFRANEKYRSGNYRVSASSLDIHRVKAKKGTVYGVTIGGEFISQNRDLYDSIDDAGLFQRGKLDAKKGRYAQTEKIADYIQRSDFFNHVFAENIEEYMKYEGNERELNEQIKTEIPDVANASSITIQNYKKEDEEKILKSMYVEIAKGTNGGMQDANAYVSDILGKVSFSLKHTLVPKLVRLLILIADNDTLKDTALQIAITHGTEDIKKTAQDVLDANTDTNANNAYHFVDLLAACDESGEAPEAFQKLDAIMNFMTDEGAGDDNNVFKGLINWEEIYGVLESAIQTYDLASGVLSKIKAKEKEMEGMTEGSDDYKTAKKELDELNDQKSEGFVKGAGGLFENVPKLFNASLAVIAGIKDTITTFKEGKWLSDEHSAEKARGSKYITWLDYVFDTGSTIVGLIQAIFDLVSGSMDTAGKENTGYGIFTKVLGTIVETFNIAKNIYNIVQSGRTMHEVSKSMDTINSYTEASDIKARENNPQVLQFLAHSRRKAGKDIADSSVDIVTGAVSIAGNFADPVTEAILGLVKKGIGTVGKLITNFVHNKLSERGTLKAAFPKEADFNEVNNASSSEFNSALQKTTGIKSKKDLAQVSRIFSAIDLHVLVKAAAEKNDTSSWGLAKTAMGTFYNIPSNDNDAKAQLKKIPLSALLSKVGEEEGWRSALQGALV